MQQLSSYGQVAANPRVQLGQVLGITALGMAVTALAVYLFPSVGGPNWIAFIGSFLLLFVMQAVRSNPTLSLLLFYVFTFIEGIVLSPIIGYYTHTAGAQVVYNAALTTALGMFALGAVVYGTGLDLRRFQGWLIGALLLLVLVGIVSMFFRLVSPTIYSWATLVIFSGLVLVDFARIRAGGDGLTAVQIALSIYLDAINIFLAILQITGRRSDD